MAHLFCIGSCSGEDICYLQITPPFVMNISLDNDV